MQQYTLRQLREIHALRQVDLAERAGVSKLTVHKWESGKAEPYLRHRRKVANLFGLEPSQVIFSEKETDDES